MLVFTKIQTQNASWIERIKYDINVVDVLLRMQEKTRLQSINVNASKLYKLEAMIHCIT